MNALRLNSYRPTGAYHTCGLREDGTPVCWLSSIEGTVLGTSVSPPPEGETFVSISSGGFHTCGLREDGTSVCWIVLEPYLDATLVSMPEGERFVSIGSGVNHTCGLREDCTHACWFYDRAAISFN